MEHRLRPWGPDRTPGLILHLRCVLCSLGTRHLQSPR